MAYTIPTAVLGLALTCSAVTHAQDHPATTPSSEKFYTELGYTPLTVRFFNGVNAKPEVARLTVGWHAHQHIDAELMAMSTLKKDKEMGMAMIGAYLKPKFTLAEDLDVFAKVGVSRMHLYGRGNGTSTRASYGIGMQKKFGDSWYGQVDFIKYGTGKNREVVQGFNVSIGTSF